MKCLNSKFIALAVCLMLVFAISAGTTYSYLYDREILINRFSFANNALSVEEDFPDPDPSEFKKQIQFANHGTDGYLRVFIAFSDNRYAERAEVTWDGVNYYPWSDYMNHLPDGWVYVSDSSSLLSGYFYYTQALEDGELSPPLTYGFRVDVDNPEDIEYLNDAIISFDIIVYGEIVQSKDLNGNIVDYARAWQEYLSRK